MHGSPQSPFDNKAIWTKYDYKDYGIVGEPYFDIDFSEVFYLTDTGRMWDGERVSVRDKIHKAEPGFRDQEGILPHTPHSAPRTSFHTTKQIIAAANNSELPDKIMFTFHPQRWTDKPLPWFWELVFQGLKNEVKRVMVSRQKIKK